MTRLPAALLVACALAATATGANAGGTIRDTYCVQVGPFNLCTPPLPLVEPGH